MANLNRGFTLKALLENPEYSDLLTRPCGQLIDAKPKQQEMLPVPFAVPTTEAPSAPQTPTPSAYLAPQVWESAGSLAVDDFTLEFMGLDDFLDETGFLLGDNETDDCMDTTDLASTLVDMGDVSSTLRRLSSPPHRGGYQAEAQQPATPHGLSAPHSLPAPAGRRSSSQNNLASLLAQALLTPEPKANAGQPVERVLMEPDHQAPPPWSFTRMTSPPSSSSGSPCPSPTHSAGNDVTIDVHFTQSELSLATIPGQDGFDPRKRSFKEEELRPQPMIKKSKKIFVPVEAKDEKYWTRRVKNNTAAKRSREARRAKENQIAMRAAFLEAENQRLRRELSESSDENAELRQRLSRYEPAADV